MRGGMTIASCLESDSNESVMRSSLASKLWRASSISAIEIIGSAFAVSRGLP